MSDTVVVANSLIVVPEFNSLVLTSTDEVVASFSNGHGVDFSRVRSIKHSDCLSIEAVPVCDLSVASSSEELRLVWVIEDLFEHGGLEQTHDSCVANDVPNDARAVIRRRNSLGVLLVDVDAGNSASVLLERHFHDLSLSADSPHSYFTFHTSRHNLLAVASAANSSGSVVMSIVDGVQQFARLWKEGSDLAVVPT